MNVPISSFQRPLQGWQEVAVQKVLTCCHTDCGAKINLLYSANGPNALCTYGHVFDAGILRKKIEAIKNM